MQVGLAPSNTMQALQPVSLFPDLADPSNATNLNLTDALAGVANAPAAGGLGDLTNEQGWQLLTQGDGPMHVPDLPPVNMSTAAAVKGSNMLLPDQAAGTVTRRANPKQDSIKPLPDLPGGGVSRVSRGTPLKETAPSQRSIDLTIKNV